MSLVAYGSSDEESDTSDSEEAQNSGVSRGVGANDHQDDAKEFSFTKGAIESAEQKGLALPSPKQMNEISNSVGRKTGLSSLLPKPKNTNSLGKEGTSDQDTSLGKKPSFGLEAMAGNDGDDDEIIEIEEEYEPLIKRAKRVASSEADDKPKSVGSLFSLLPAPWQAANTWQKGGEHEKKTSSKRSGAEERKTKQPIKIAIPTAPKTDSDEEDDMETEKKVVAPSKEGSGLKLLLPKPKHSITLKADNPNKPAVKLASRPLIPHTLTKKATVTAEKKPQKSTRKNQGEDAISDDEDEPVSFFTFSEKSEDTTPDKNIETLDSKLSSVKSNEPYKLKVKSAPVSSLLGGEMLSTATTFQSSKKHFNEVAPSPVMEEPSAQASFGSEESINTGELETRTYYYDQQPEQPQQYGSHSANDYENYKYDSSSTSTGQPDYNQGAETYTYTYPTGMVEQTQNQPHETDIDLEKLQRLKGRKNRHEEINIVDVNAADQIGNSAEMVAKYGTEEVTHTPSRKKKDMPTAQQRRKHQITYLAFQAKEREFELRQQWSANRQTRRQTQSKYGF